MISCKECNKEFSSKHGLSNHIRYGCATIRHIEYRRKCPDCNKILEYKQKFKYATLNNCCCKPCWSKTRIGIRHSEESKKKMSDKQKGRVLSEQHKLKIGVGLKKSSKYLNYINSEEFKVNNEKRRISNIGRRASEESRRLMSENHSNVSGENNPFYGKTHTSEVKLKLSKLHTGKCLSQEHKDKLRIIGLSKPNRLPSFKGKSHSEKTKRKMRKIAIDRISDTLRDGEKILPNYNKTACDYFNNLMLETKTNIQHACNGGEFYIEELGYWVDGYDKENNIVYEWDERRHFNRDGTLKEKDINRQREITEYLKCKFIRIKDPKVLV